ncbi:galactocerebrosidase-like [Haliotis rufescens]|uniref:galactocerebrosidase-like n=1 Tax=Haliotis rufescens TaxID=6454 RepID=UPI00201F28A6|nr:galactocerebrosidase-like [Haliotis rufescens]
MESGRVFIAVAGVWALFVTAHAAKPYPIDDSTGYGRTFDGIGGISGGGATSKLLVNYPQPYRDQVLDFLFKPNFGAALQILKVEIGGDACSTDGSEASHMHNSWEENYQRGYEWWLMLEAKKRNPNIKLYGLPWAFPGWVGGPTRDNPWTDPERPAYYVLNWLRGAKAVHNLTIDYLGIWNERMYSIPYIKLLRKTLDDNGFSNVKIVGADKKWEIADDILQDEELGAAVENIGCHYPGTFSDPSAMKTGKQLWASEDYSTFNDNVGGGCWGRILNMNYVNGNMTATISWNAIASYYNPLPWFRTGLMTAVEPWTGNYAVESPIWITAHTTQFTEIGWRYLRHGAGVGNFTGGGSYVSLVSPDGKDLTIVIETMSHDHSICVRPPLEPYNVTKQRVTFQLKGSFASITSLNMWYSRLFNGAVNVTGTMFERQAPLKVVNGMVQLDVAVDEAITLTTVSGGQKGSYPPPPSSQPFPSTYNDDFEGYPEHMEPNNLAQQTGSFEIIDVGSPHNKVVRQMVLSQPVHWCKAEGRTNRSINLIGNYNWTDVTVQMDAKVGEVNGSSGYFVAARVDRGGGESDQAEGIFLYIFPNKSKYHLSGDFEHKKGITEGELPSSNSDWNNVMLTVQGGTASGTYNNQKLFNVSIPANPKYGFVAIGTDSWGIVDYDNLMIKAKPVANLRQKPKDNTLYYKPKA